MKKLLFIVIVLLISVSGYSATITVDDDGPADFNNIQLAIDASSMGDTILVKQGVYDSITINSSQEVILTSTDPANATVVANTIIRQQGQGPVITLEYNDSSIYGFTITDGDAGKGGGIYCEEYCDPHISNCVIVNNTAKKGGGIFAGNGSDIFVENCIFQGNQALQNAYGLIAEGGGIYAGGGGRGYPKIMNCLFYDNHAVNAGGALYITAVGATVSGCTIVDNTSADCGGFYLNQYQTAQISNSILWGNTNGQIFGSPVVSYSNIQDGFTGTGNRNQDPLFVDYANDNFHLTANSPCKDSGDPAYIPDDTERDFDSEFRLMGNRVDMGVDEENDALVPIIGYSPKTFLFRANQNGDNPESQTLLIRNAGQETMQWTVDDNCSWMSLSPVSGETTSLIEEVTLTVDISGLDLGIHKGEVTIVSGDAPNSPVNIPITLYIRPAGGKLLVNSDYDTIQDAVNVAQPGDTVIIAPGTYTGEGNRDIDLLGKSITVQSEDPDNPAIVASTIIDCQGTTDELHRGFIFQNGEDFDTLLSGITITGGNTKKGCGIYIKQSSPKITKCLITECSNTESGSEGGGIYCLNGYPTISHCSITNNTVRNRGAGIYIYHQRRSDSNQAVISNCTITNNTVTFRQGGGIYSRHASITLENNVISSNTANDGGGGVCFDYSEGVITNCLITNNSSGAWGGGLNIGGKVSLLNNTIANNQSSVQGGGIHLDMISSDIDIQNNIIWSNSAGTGDQISMYIWHGVYDGIDPPVEDHGSELRVNYCDIQGGQTGVYTMPYNLDYLRVNQWGSNNIDVDPLFVNPNGTDGAAGTEDDNFRLSADSLCIDAGDNTVVPADITTDLNGYYRFIDHINTPDTGNGTSPIVDMGAYEFLSSDIDGNGDVNLKDFGQFLSYWMENDCGTCGGADLTSDGNVNVDDLSAFTNHWLEGAATNN